VDKARFRATLELLGLAHPTTRSLTGLSDLDDVRDDVLSSSFLKPAHSQQFFARFGVKAFRVAGREDARRRLAGCIDAGCEMLLQQYIPGPPTNHYFVDGFVDRTGDVRAIFARRRLRMNPPDFGNSTLMISIATSDAQPAISAMRALLTHLQYRGIFSAEFKRDERTGVFNLIEVNARPWWYVEFAARCGVNVCEMALDDALGESVASVTSYDVGRRCVFPYYDFDAVRADHRARRVNAIDWARSWVGAYQPVFRWTDPWPALTESATLVVQHFRRRK
jgi:predicted ATP-grasp superfamily ATP-dependent carboligase